MNKNFECFLKVLLSIGVLMYNIYDSVNIKVVYKQLDKDII